MVFVSLSDMMCLPSLSCEVCDVYMVVKVVHSVYWFVGVLFVRRMLSQSGDW